VCFPKELLMSCYVIPRTILTMTNASRSSNSALLYPGNVPTFGELIIRIQADGSLSTARRSNLCSSIPRLALALGKDVEDVHAYPPTLRPLMKDLHPAQLGLSQKRWQNIRADVVFAIKHHGDSAPAATRSQELCAAQV
jgi:hypothetical protein